MSATASIASYTLWLYGIRYRATILYNEISISMIVCVDLYVIKLIIFGSIEAVLCEICDTIEITTITTSIFIPFFSKNYQIA